MPLVLTLGRPGTARFGSVCRTLRGRLATLRATVKSAQTGLDQVPRNTSMVARPDTTDSSEDSLQRACSK